jgi:hypothetical protein
MAFFYHVSPWPETTHWPLASPLLSAQRSAAQRRATGCRRVDEPTSVRKFRVACGGATCFICAPRPSTSCLLPARFRAGRSGWHKNNFCSTMGLFSSNGLRLMPCNVQICICRRRLLQLLHSISPTPTRYQVMHSVVRCASACGLLIPIIMQHAIKCAAVLRDRRKFLRVDGGRALIALFTVEPC